jgi:hypothetical protein
LRITAALLLVAMLHAAPSTASAGLAIDAPATYTPGDLLTITLRGDCNIGEWNEAILNGSFRGVRGGGFNTGTNELSASTRATFTADPNVDSGGIGSRVASLIPEPGTGLLVMLGMLSLAGGRRPHA